MRFALVHSPLVGPSTWRPVADVLTALGHEVALPDLRAAARSGDPHVFISAAQAVVSADTDVVAGHSGAGFFLPSIAAANENPAPLMFVDAGIPPNEGSATPGGDFIDQLHALSNGGMLPRWSRWWGEGVMEHLVPDRRLRAEIEAELVEVPLAFYEDPVKLPARWRDAPAGFLLLSESYRADAATALSLGWPTRELLGAHLDLANHPGTIARSMLELCAPSADVPDRRVRDWDDVRVAATMSAGVENGTASANGTSVTRRPPRSTNALGRWCHPVRTQPVTVATKTWNPSSSVGAPPW